SPRRGGGTGGDPSPASCDRTRRARGRSRGSRVRATPCRRCARHRERRGFRRGPSRRAPRAVRGGCCATAEAAGRGAASLRAAGAAWRAGSLETSLDATEATLALLIGCACEEENALAEIG